MSNKKKNEKVLVTRAGKPARTGTGGEACTPPSQAFWSPVLLVMEGFRDELGDRWNLVRKAMVEGPVQHAAWRVCTTLQSVKKWTLSTVDARIERLNLHRQEQKLQDDEISRFDDEGGGQQPVSAP